MKKLNKAFNVYKELSPQIKMSFWFLVCSFLQKGIGMITTPIFTRVMLDTEYGRFNVYSTWLNIFTVFATLNVSGNCFTRGLVVHSEDRNGYTSSLQFLSIILTACGFLIYTCFSGFLNSLTGLNPFLVALMFAEMALISAYNFWINRKRVEIDYRSITILTFVYALLRPVVAVLFVLKAKPEFQVEARVAATFVVSFFLFVPIIFSNILKGKVLYHKLYWKETIIFCLPLIFHYLSNIILTQSDRLMIDRLCGSSYTAYYSVAYSIGMIVQIFNNAVSTSYTPWIYKSIKNEKYRQIEKVSYQVLALIAALNLLTVSFAPEILKVMAPSNYQLALWAIPPVTASVYFMFMYDIFAAFSFYYKKTSWIGAATLASAILNLVLNYIYIPKYGFVAAGYTTLICYILFAILHYFFMNHICKVMGIKGKVFKGVYIVSIGLFLTIGCGVMMLLYKYLPVRLAIFMISILIALLNRQKLIGIIKQLRSGN